MQKVSEVYLKETEFEREGKTPPQQVTSSYVICGNCCNCCADVLDMWKCNRALA